MNATQEAGAVGRRADNSDLLDHAVRIGLICYGVVHLLVAWLAAQLALGSGEGSASSQGALSQLAEQPFGSVLLWVVAFGFFALVVWQLVEAAVGHRDEDGKARVAKRLGSGLKVVLYGALGVSALQVATGAGSGGGGTDTMTARLMRLPFGSVLVAAVGIAVIGFAVRLAYKGLSEEFTERLDVDGHTGTSGRAFVTFGKVGYVSKGVALTVVGGLFVWAAVAHDPDKSGGLDQALRTVLHQPYGPALLLAIAAGIACFGVYCFAWARHLDR
jgi:hypothetical protein